MHVAIVVANGMRSFAKAASIQEQDELFQSVGSAIAAWTLEALEDFDACTLFGANAIDAPCTTTMYTSGRKLKSELLLLKEKNSQKPFVVIIVGHGHETGYVDLIDLALDPSVLEPYQYQIHSSDINVIKPTWYIGLHCHAGSLIKNLSEGIYCYGIVGEETASSSHLIDLRETKKHKEAYTKFLIKVRGKKVDEAKLALKVWEDINPGKAFVK
jgi:hypothetical protein